MTDISQTPKQKVAQKTRGRKKAGALRIFAQGVPAMAVGAVSGLVIYNPAFSLVDAFRIVFLEGSANLNDANGQQLPFYMQPANIGLLIVMATIGFVLWFKWEVARNEKIFMFAVLVLWGLVNLLILGVWQTFAPNPFSMAWIQWQLPAALMSAVTFGMYIPKIRRAASDTITAGGGAFDAVTVTEYDHDHADE